jgi:hypothetical protein
VTLTELCQRTMDLHTAVEGMKGYCAVIRYTGKAWGATIGKYFSEGKTEVDAVTGLITQLTDIVRRDITEKTAAIAGLGEIVR